MQALELDYDIPIVSRTVTRGGQTRRVKVSSFPNPSPILRRIGFRISDSVWVLLEGSEPWNLLNEFTNNDPPVVWHLNPFAVKANEKLVEQCRTALLKEIESAKTRALESFQRINKKCEASDKPERVQTALKEHINVMKRAQLLLKDLEHAAGVFGIDVEELNTTSALSAVQVMTNEAKSRALVYSQMTEKTVGTDMQAAAEQDAIPAPILADFLEERGEDVAAARDLFSTVP